MTALELSEAQRQRDRKHHEERLAWLAEETPRYADGEPVAKVDIINFTKQSIACLADESGPMKAEWSASTLRTIAIDRSHSARRMPRPAAGSNHAPPQHITTMTTTKTPLLAFHNDPAIKDKYLARVRAHAAADEIINGQYWEDGCGCAVGCTIHGSSHAEYEEQLGIPSVLARLEDKLFEAIYITDPAFSKAWPERFLSAVNVGSDLAMVWPKFAHWLLVDPEVGVIKFAKSERSKSAIEKVGALYARWIGGEKPAKEEWAAAADAADAADAAAAADAADAAYAAYAAADAAAAYAAYAAYAAAADAARAKHYRTMADKLIQLMKEAK